MYLKIQCKNLIGLQDSWILIFEDESFFGLAPFNCKLTVLSVATRPFNCVFVIINSANADYNPNRRTRMH
jgi:hypothetical protein